MEELKDDQILALRIIAACSSALGILGSSILIFMIKKEPRKIPFHRMIFCLSVSDIIHSFWWSLGSLPNVEGYSVGARGTQASCTAQGFFMHSGHITLFYNACIMAYFILKIRYRWTVLDFEKRSVEKAMHIFSLFVPLAGAIGLAVGGYFNPTPSVYNRCYIYAFPPECENDDTMQCTRGKHAAWFRIVFALLPAVVLYIFLFCSIFIIYLKVRQQAFRMRRYLFSAGQSLAVTEAVYTHSILYGVSFFLTYFFTGVMLVTRISFVSGSHPNINAWLYPIRVLKEMFYPLQGLFNCIIYWHAKRSGDFTNQSRRRRCSNTRSTVLRRSASLILSGLSSHPSSNGDVTSLPTRTTNSGAEIIPPLNLECTEAAEEMSPQSIESA
jgi:hypothetical protein